MLLPVHLPGLCEIVFYEQDYVKRIQEVLDRSFKLEAYFYLNAEDRNARDLFYVQIPEYYVWQTRTSTWVRRQTVSKMIGAVCGAGPNNPQIELFYLRILLLQVKGSSSFDQLRTVDG